MESTYTYCERNLLDRGEYYMYSAYGGAQFLRDYFSLRKSQVLAWETIHRHDMHSGNESLTHIEWLIDCRYLLNSNVALLPDDILQHHRTKLENVPVPNDNHEGRPDSLSLGDFEPKSSFGTDVLLSALLKSVTAKDESEQSTAYRWLSKLVHRFEVSKKLYDSYQTNMKRATDAHRTIENYSLLAVCCLGFHEWTGNMKFMNTALKLNDLLCSLDKLDGSWAQLLAIISVRQELALMDEVCRKMGVHYDT